MNSTLDAQTFRADSDLGSGHGPLRVLLITEASAKGTGRHVADLAEGLIARECEVHLLYSPIRSDDNFRSRINAIRGLKHVALPMDRGLHPRDLRAVWATRRYLRRFGPFDVIHGHSSKGGAVARLAAIGSGVPAIYTPHSLVTMDPDLPPLTRLFYRVVEIALSWLTAYIIAVAPEEARAAIAMGIHKSRVAMVPNGIEELPLAERNGARRKYGIVDGEFVIGSVGRLVAYKAPESLVEAVALAAPDAPHLRLVFVGDGPLRSCIADLATRLGISNKVTLLGELDAKQVLSAFDVFAIASRKEGMPYVVLEAMVAGLPIVATSTSGVELLVEPGVNGAVVSPDDRKALSAAIVALANDPALIARQGMASRNLVARFAPGRMVERTMALYRSCTRADAAEADPQLAGEGV